MRIVIASSEAVPFAKTGGLADVSSALAKALDVKGHQVSLIMPYYPELIKNNSAELPAIHELGTSLEITIGKNKRTSKLLGTTLPDSDVSVLMVDQSSYFHRPGLYQQDGGDYHDNSERFIFFSRSVMEIIQKLYLRPDIIHANDWQTGLIPALLDLQYRKQSLFEKTASVFTIHNMAFQGQFRHWDMNLTGLDWKYFNWEQLEFYDHLNLLKSGVVFSEMVTTVSPTYSKEIQTPEFGCGLENVLVKHRDKLKGILNGVDMSVWNPKIDPFIPENYSEKKLEGKSVCKNFLQKELGLPENNQVPLFGMVSRMTDQKGLDLLEQCADEILSQDIQICFLGTGSHHFEDFLRGLVHRYPDKVSATIGFDEKLAHRIEAGADIYLMPSRYEPCGLNQMYSLIYGTIPIVHSTGGLADSVVGANAKNLKAGTATGFCFDEYQAGKLVEQINRAVTLFHDQPQWKKLVSTAMIQDCSWEQSASEYLKVYEEALERI
jgi:starch synthase